jgi:hypothetical protein
MAKMPKPKRRSLKSEHAAKMAPETKKRVKPANTYRTESHPEMFFAEG